MKLNVSLTPTEWTLIINGVGYTMYDYTDGYTAQQKAENKRVAKHNARVQKLIDKLTNALGV